MNGMWTRDSNTPFAEVGLVVYLAMLDEKCFDASLVRVHLHELLYFKNQGSRMELRELYRKRGKAFC